MEDDSGQIGWVWGWSGVGWWATKSAIGGGDQIDCQDRYQAWGFRRRDRWFDLEAAVTAGVGGGWWVVDWWHVVEDLAMVGQRKRERMREEEKRDDGCSLYGGRQMVDGACTVNGGWWTKLARRPKLAQWSDSSGALSLSLSLFGLLSSKWGWKSFGGKMSMNWFYRVWVLILWSTEIGFQFDRIFMRIQTLSRV